MSKSSEWLNSKFNDLRKEFGGCCQKCGSKMNLEFAHVRPTGLKSKGRGKKKRYYDIKNNKECYILLCKDCHLDLDSSGTIKDFANFIKE